jgi:hypothetical protein
MDREINRDLSGTTCRQREFVMQETVKKDIGKLFKDREGMDRAFARAVRQALLQRKRMGNPVAVWG